MDQLFVGRPNILNKPLFMKRVEEILSTRVLTNNGPFLRQLESLVANDLGVKHVLGVSNATIGLELAIKALIPEPGGEILLPSFTFIATAHAVSRMGFTPKFVDIKSDYTIDVRDLLRKVNSRTKGVIACNLFGNLCDTIELDNLPIYPKIPIIYDSAHALGVCDETTGIYAGNYGDCEVFSLHATKFINSVTPETPVLIRLNKKDTYLKPIGSLDKSIIGQECMSFSQEGQTRWSNIKDFIVHDIDDYIYSIKTRTGRITHVTGVHSLFKYDQEKFIPILAKDIKVGDYIAAPRHLNITHQETPIRIDLLDLLKDEKILVRGEKIRLSSGRDRGNAGKWINRYLTLDETVAKILGYYAAEGGIYKLSPSKNTTPTQVKFSFGSHEVDTHITDLINCLKTVWPVYKIGLILSKESAGANLSIGSTLLSKIFLALGAGKGVYEKKIPSAIFNSPKIVKEAFLEAFINGDGHRRVQDGYTTLTGIKSASEELANGLHYLLLSIGKSSSISSYVSKTKQGSPRVSYQLDIIGYNNQNQSHMNYIPKEFVQEKTRKQSFSLNNIKLKDLGCPKNLLGDIALLKVINVEKSPYKGPVYDFSVEGDENFIGGYGAISLHNSGEGGLITTNNDELAAKIELARNFGFKPDAGLQGEVIDFGTNAKMAEIPAALALTNFEGIQEITEKLFDNYQLYKKHLPRGFQMKEKNTLFSNYSYIVVEIAGGYGQDHIQRDRILSYLAERGVFARHYFYPCHLTKPYRKNIIFLPKTEQLSSRILCLPTGLEIGEAEIIHVCSLLREALDA